MTDYVSVKALKTFDYSGLKTKRSKPFDVEAGEAKQMKAMGLVNFVTKSEPKPELRPDFKTKAKKGEPDGKSDDK